MKGGRGGERDEKKGTLGRTAWEIIWNVLLSWEEFYVLHCAALVVLMEGSMPFAGIQSPVMRGRTALTTTSAPM